MAEDPFGFLPALGIFRGRIQVQLVLMEWQMEPGAFCPVLLLHIAGEASPSHICHLLVELHGEITPWGRKCGRTASSHPLTPEPRQTGNIHQDQDPQRDGRTWWRSSGWRISGTQLLDVAPSQDPSRRGSTSIPADPCASAGRQPVGQDTRIWGSGYPWILLECSWGAPAVPDGDPIPIPEQSPMAQSVLWDPRTHCPPCPGSGLPWFVQILTLAFPLPSLAPHRVRRHWV